MPTRVFVTGAGGFIGRAAAKHLWEAGCEVVGLDRDAALIPAGVTAVAGDTTAPELWSAHLDGVKVVIHTAAVVSNVAPLTRAWEVNVAGTARTLVRRRRTHQRELGLWRTSPRVGPAPEAAGPRGRATGTLNSLDPLVLR